MASTVNVPIIGKANKGTVIGVSIGGLAVAGYMIYRQQKKNKAAAAASAAAAKQAAGYGYGYGSLYPQGYYGYGEPGYSPYGYGSMGYTPGYYGYGTPYPQSPSAPVTTNAQWVQAAINVLSGEGYNAQSLSAALGAYITGSTVSTDQQSMIQAAIGVEGYPPQPGASGYPPAIKVQGQGSGGDVAVPNVIGMNRVNSKKTIEQAGLVYQQANVIHGAAHATSENPAANTQVPSGSTVTVTMSQGRPSVG